MVYTYGSVILWDLNFGSFCEWWHLPDLEAYVLFQVTTVLLFHILNDNTSLFIPFVQLNDVEGSLLVHLASKCFGFIMPNNHN